MEIGAATFTVADFLRALFVQLSTTVPRVLVVKPMSCFFGENASQQYSFCLRLPKYGVKGG